MGFSRNVSLVDAASDGIADIVFGLHHRFDFGNDPVRAGAGNDDGAVYVGDDVVALRRTVLSMPRARKVS